MWPLSAEAQKAIRTSYSYELLVEVWNGAVRKMNPNGSIYNLPVIDGEVSVDAGSRVRRKLTMTTPGNDASWDLLQPTGVELKVFYGIRLPTGAVELVPLGVFGVDDESRDYGPQGTISITAPDRWARVQRAKFERIRQTSGNAVASIVDLVQEAIPGVPVAAYGSYTYRATRARWPSDRDDAIGQLAKAANVDVSFDPTGSLRIRNAPVLAKRQPNWRVDASVAGVQLSASRTRSRQKTYNVVLIRPSVTDGSPPFPLLSVEDRDPNSPTFVGGPFGRVPMEYSNPLIRSATQARAVGFTLLDRMKSIGAQLQLTALVNPALEDGDVVGAILPRKIGQSIQVERHLVESCNIPLRPAAQNITTRSTQPDDSQDGGIEAGYISWQDVLYDEPTWTAVLADYATWSNIMIDLRVGGV